MVLVTRCCFIVPIKPAVMLIGLAFMTISFIGLLLSTSSVLLFLSNPKDPLLRWLLQVCYFVHVQGIAFHAVLFIISTLLACAVVSNVSPLLVPWLAASPLFIIAMLVQIALVIVQQPDLALPVAAFCLMILLFMIYATAIVAAYYKQVNLRILQLRMYNIERGELPRIVHVPQRPQIPFAHAHFPGTSFSGSAQPLQDFSGREDPSSAEKWPKLSHAYARLKQVRQPPPIREPRRY